MDFLSAPTNFLAQWSRNLTQRFLVWELLVWKMPVWLMYCCYYHTIMFIILLLLLVCWLVFFFLLLLLLCYYTPILLLLYYCYVCMMLRPVHQSRVSLLRVLESNFPGDPYQIIRTWEFPPLTIKSLLESNPSKSKLLIGGLGVLLGASPPCGVVGGSEASSLSTCYFDYYGYYYYYYYYYYY